MRYFILLSALLFLGCMGPGHYENLPAVVIDAWHEDGMDYDPATGIIMWDTDYYYKARTEDGTVYRRYGRRTIGDKVYIRIWVPDPQEKNAASD